MNAFVVDGNTTREDIVKFGTVAGRELVERIADKIKEHHRLGACDPQNHAAVGDDLH